MSDPRPLSYGQQAQLFLYRLAPHATAYNTGIAVRIRSAVDSSALADAVTALGHRHEMLRSLFTEVAGRPVRLVADGHAPRLKHRTPACGTEEELARAVSDGLREPFRLDEDGAFRVVLLTRAERDAVLLIAGHHIATDALSDALLLRDLLKLYEERVTGVPAELPRLRTDHDELVAREEALLASPRGARLAEQWRSLCEGSAAAELPPDRPRGPQQSFSGATYRVTVDRRPAQHLTRTARDAGVTPFAVLLGAFQGTLHRTTRQRDFLLGCPVTTRLRPATRDLVGNFVNTVVLRARIASETTFADAAQGVDAQLRSAMQGVEYPFAHVARSVGRSPAAGGHRVYGITFNFLATAGLDVALRPLLDTAHTGTVTTYAGLTLTPFALPQQEGQLDLGVDVLQGDHGLTLDFRYDDQLFDRDSVARLAVHFLRAVDLATTAPDTPVARARLWGAPPPRTAVAASAEPAHG
ncbi:condensation domain-containing protein [Streptomyces sp. NPDC059168]|uniref:condensation domain-containing protein n=1 Tax=Streptomyces sp. NPDC059168 TaxID=3346753 RepID=UPI0036D00D4B